MRHNGKIQQNKMKTVNGDFQYQQARPVYIAPQIEPNYPRKAPVYHIPQIHATQDFSPAESEHSKKLVFAPIVSLVPDLQYFQFVL